MSKELIWNLIWLVTGPLGAIIDLIVESTLYKALPWNLIERDIDRAVDEMQKEGTWMSENFMRRISVLYLLAGLFVPLIGWGWLKTTITESIPEERSKRKGP